MGEGIHNPYDDTALMAAIADLDDALILIAAALVIIDNELGQVHTVVDAIRVVTDATPVLTETGGTVTADGTEQNVYINNAPAGVYKPICVKIDFTDHTATETVVLRTYYRIADGGALIQDDEVTYIGVPTVSLINIELLPTRFGVQVTLEKTAGTNRDYLWEAFYEETP